VIAVLLALLVAAAWFQVSIAAGDRDPYPGPVPGTPFPTASP
jgi:hypothetical protein